MLRPWTVERLTALSGQDRIKLYRNARENDSVDADDIIEMLFQHRLVDSIGGGLPRSHRTIVDVEAICRSPEGVDAAVKAATAGEAPMAGVDPLLRRAVREYGYFDTTGWAGGFVAEEMEALGWRRHGRKALPVDRIAKTAAFFLPPETK